MAWREGRRGGERDAMDETEGRWIEDRGNENEGEE